MIIVTYDILQLLIIAAFFPPPPQIPHIIFIVSRLIYESNC